MGNTERPHYRGIVFVDGVECSDLHCLSIERSVGMNPSRAMIQQTLGQDVMGPVALRLPADVNFQYGQRVTIIGQTGSTLDSTPMFNGWLLKRSDQCRSDKIIWQAIDDRVLMQWVALRGCLVYDPADSALCYAPRMPLHFNPGGFWNCTGYDIDGTVYPVFTINSRKVQAYEAPNTAVGLTTLTEGAYSPWTPRRALYYLQLWSRVNQLNDVVGLDKTKQASLDPAGALRFRRDEIAGMVGYDPIGADAATDPLDRKLNDLRLQGGTLLAGINRVLDVAGTHSMHTQPLVSPDQSISRVEYQMTGYAVSGGGERVVIQRSGQVGDTRLLGDFPNCFDFHFDEDASQLAQSVLVEGDVIRAEASLIFTPPSAGTAYYDDTTSDIIPAWTKAQESAFLECIHGGPYSSPATAYAKRATYSGNTTLEVCDGTSGKPLIWARSREALEAARESFPTVFRAWKLNGQTTKVQTILGLPLGTGGGLKDGRPLLPEQLQFLTNQYKTGIDSWLLVNLPIRVRLLDPSTSDYYEVPRDLSLRVTGDGTIWLDGLAEGASGTMYACFLNDLMNETAYRAQTIVLRGMKINAAFPTDQRVMGFKAVTADTGLPPYPYLASALPAAFVTGGALLNRYQDVGAVYKRHLQYQSEPANSAQYYGGTDGTTPTASPLTRDIPPGSEAIHAEYDAQRTLARFCNPHRQATFSMIGIQPTWRPGARISYVDLKDPAGTVGGNKTYYFNGCIGTVLHDFLAQSTTLGGLIGEYGSPTTGGA